MKLVGLTGGVASGKSTVAGFFKDLGVPTINTDEVANELTLQDENTIDEIIDTFGKGILTAGKPDKQKLKSIVFNDKAQRQKLEQILHPRIKTRLHIILASKSAPYAIIEVPLLFEIGWNKFMDRSLLCVAPINIRITRLTQRDGINEELANKIIAAQMSDEKKREFADDIIVTNQKLPALNLAVLNLHKNYLRVLQ